MVDVYGRKVSRRWRADFCEMDVRAAIQDTE